MDYQEQIRQYRPSGKWHGVKIHTLDIYTTLGVEKYLVLSAQKIS